MYWSHSCKIIGHCKLTYISPHAEITMRYTEKYDTAQQDAISVHRNAIENGKIKK